MNTFSLSFKWDLGDAEGLAQKHIFLCTWILEHDTSLLANFETRVYRYDTHDVHEDQEQMCSAGGQQA